MDRDEYGAQMRGLFTEYLLKAVAQNANPAQCYRMACELMKEHDALVLSFDPLAPGTGKSGAVLKLVPGSPGSGGGR